MKAATDHLEFVPRVLPRHGQMFAKLLTAESIQSEIPTTVFGLTGLIEWPQEPTHDTPAKLRYERLEHEILRRTLRETEEAIAEAFVRIASEVIERERAMDGKE